MGKYIFLRLLLTRTGNPYIVTYFLHKLHNLTATILLEMTGAP